MATTKKQPQNKNPLIGNQAQPTVLDKTIKTDIDVSKN